MLLYHLSLTGIVSRAGKYLELKSSVTLVSLILTASILAFEYRVADDHWTKHTSASCKYKAYKLAGTLNRISSLEGLFEQLFIAYF